MADTNAREGKTGMGTRQLEGNIALPTHLDLFSGIGGFALAARWAGFRTIGFCEIDKYCRKVLAKNFGAIPYAEIERCGQRRPRRPDSIGARESEQALGNARSVENRRLQQSELSPNTGTGSPIFSNIFDLNGRDFTGVSLITGGFPCQPFSVAGKHRGAADDRAIWPEMFRVISEARPAWVLGENVPGIIAMELDNVLSDLEGIGYATRAFVVPACAVNAKHRRDRIWIIGRNMGNTSLAGLEGYGDTQISDSQGWENKGGYFGTPGGSGAMANSTASGLSFTGLESREREADADVRTEQCCRWLPEPDLGRVVAGLPEKLDGRLNEQMDGKETITTRYLTEWEMLREMWHDRELAKASPELRVRSMLYSLCSMSYHYGSASWNEAAEKDQEVFHLWQRISTESFQKAQDLFPTLLERIGANQCEQTVASWITEPDVPRVAHGIKDRVNRLKGLGNAIVPKVAYEILREIYKLCLP